MKYLEEYREPALARRLLGELGRTATRMLCRRSPRTLGTNDAVLILMAVGAAGAMAGTPEQANRLAVSS
ncbi:hypothetical protein [Actinacidiphila soli]|uniref:hypothetical protein n=1 Tax=Actinacidiphila soli TaxID=2487275 RepID=UPI0038991D3D